MTRTEAAVSSRFAKLLERITPDEDDEGVFFRHEGELRRRICATLPIHDLKLIGSYSRSSAIRGTSDIDLLLILKAEAIRWGPGLKSSETVLNRVRDQLRHSYPRTEVGRDGQAVVVPFQDGRHPVDVVPAFFAGMSEHKRPTYRIPDGRGGWMPTSPESHNDFIGDADRRSGGKLKGVARLVKFWAGTRVTSVSLSGFHVELLLADTGICSVGKGYADCFADCLIELRDRKCRALRDPLRISGPIPVAGTTRKLAALYSAVRTSANHGALAQQLSRSTTAEIAIHRWNLAFNNGFPR